MPQMGHRTKYAAVAIVLLISGLLVSRFTAIAPSVVPPPDNYFAGWTQQQVIHRLGAPSSQFPGHYGLPNAQWATQHEPCVTLAYEKWNGTLYLSVEPKNGHWA